MLRDRFLSERKFPSIIVKSTAGHYSLDFHAEQEPSAASRVTLSDQRDELGMQRLLVDWRYTPLTLGQSGGRWNCLPRMLSAAGSVSLITIPSRSSWRCRVTVPTAAIISARPGWAATREPSVVDADCRVHGVDNLFIAGSAVFPTSSQANPTLTIVALAVRLAAHLKNAAAGARAAIVELDSDAAER